MSIKIHIPVESKQGLGGGFSFIRNFEKFASSGGVEIVSDYKLADVVLVASPTMIQRALFDEIKSAGKKIVLRVDNAVKNSRNRNTGSSRLKDFSARADMVIYQSQWASKYLSPFTDRAGPVILNGVDHTIFKEDGEAQPKEGKYQFAFLQYNRDETKRWHEAWYEFTVESQKRDDAHLWIIGRFSPENIQYNFDFFMGEKYRYIGVLEDPEDLAEYYRSIDELLLPYFNDACSNTLIEALLCGCHVKCNETGGNAEILKQFKEDKSQLSAESMVKKYAKEFETLCK